MALTVRQHFPDLDLVDMLPALNSVMFRKFKSRKPAYSRFFNVKTSTRSMEQSAQVLGVGLFKSVPEGGTVGYDQPVPGFNKTWIHSQYALGVMFSKLLQMNAKWPIIQRTMEDLGASARETVEILAASVYNNAFSGSYLGPDGVPLCSANHPLPKYGGVQSNTMTAADLDVTSLRAAMIASQKMVDATGKQIMVPYTRLVVPVDLEPIAIELTKSQYRPDTANNALNSMRETEENPLRNYELYRYLTDDDTWFLSVPKGDLPLIFWWRERPNPVHDIDFDSRNLKSAMWMQFSYGWDDYQGIFGVPGA